jgi:hypothetical protein
MLAEQSNHRKENCTSPRFGSKQIGSPQRLTAIIRGCFSPLHPNLL